MNLNRAVFVQNLISKPKTEWRSVFSLSVELDIAKDILTIY